MRVLRAAGLLAVALALGAYVVALPRGLPANYFDGITGDAARGARVFTAAGCASCHMAPGAAGDAELVLVGGQEFPTAFGTFVAPNISNDPQAGIGAWGVLDLGNALLRGVGRGGEHLYPALPYASYQKMTRQDVADLRAYLATLPADPTPSQPHHLSFPFNIRATLGLWKVLYLDPTWVVKGDLPPEAQQGRYIAEALAHCGECHTPRDVLGGMERGKWLSGAPNPDGQGRVPDIRPQTLGWSQDEIVTYLTTGITPDFDSVGGHMAHVVDNMAKLPASDVQAIAAYLLALPKE
ncbi:MAG: diacylglycerol kinase [Rhodobacteraceae bacterium]|nr:diacylglycerol kinase [Paracoccaceae bacterium]